jgi:hypothetical protein
MGFLDQLITYKIYKRPVIWSWLVTRLIRKTNLADKLFYYGYIWIWFRITTDSILQDLSTDLRWNRFHWVGLHLVCTSVTELLPMSLCSNQAHALYSVCLALGSKLTIPPEPSLGFPLHVPQVETVPLMLRWDEIMSLSNWGVKGPVVCPADDIWVNIEQMRNDAEWGNWKNRRKISLSAKSPDRIPTNVDLRGEKPATKYLSYSTSRQTVYLKVGHDHFICSWWYCWLSKNSKESKMWKDMFLSMLPKRYGG